MKLEVFCLFFVYLHDMFYDQTLEHVYHLFKNFLSFSNLSPSLYIPSIRVKAAVNVIRMSIYLSYSQKNIHIMF